MDISDNFVSNSTATCRKNNCHLLFEKKITDAAVKKKATEFGAAWKIFRMFSGRTGHFPDIFDNIFQTLYGEIDHRLRIHVFIRMQLIYTYFLIILLISLIKKFIP